MQTAVVTLLESCGQIDLLNPDPSSIHLPDIALSLSRQPRWIGHTRGDFGYSVAQHSLAVARRLNGTPWQLEGLMHDAHEAYLGDISRPVSVALGAEAVEAMKERLDVVIASVFGLDRSPECLAAVREADDAAMEEERRQLVRGIRPESRLDRLVPYAPKFVCGLFTGVFNELNAVRKREGR